MEATPFGTNACFRTPARRASESPTDPSRLRQRSTIAVMRASSFFVEMQLAAVGPGDGLHGQVVCGEAGSAGRDDKVDPLIGEEAELRGSIHRPVTAQGEVGDVHTHREELLCHPRPVAVGDPTGQHLVAPDHLRVLT